MREPLKPKLLYISGVLPVEQPLYTPLNRLESRSFPTLPSPGKISNTVTFFGPPFSWRRMGTRNKEGKSYVQCTFEKGLITVEVPFFGVSGGTLTRQRGGLTRCEP